MARSKYIYIVTDEWNTQQMGFFTVKHEAISWIQDKMNDYLRSLERRGMYPPHKMRLFRYLDSSYAESPQAKELHFNLDVESS